MQFENILEKVYDLSRNKKGDHESPHKPLLLLTLLDLVEAGVSSDNRFIFDSVLFDTWRAYFDIVKTPGDNPTIENPIYYLRSDNIWNLLPLEEGVDSSIVSTLNSAPSKKWLGNNVFGQLDLDIMRFISSPQKLSQLRSAIVGRYFPAHREVLMAQTLHNVVKLSMNTKEAVQLVEDDEYKVARSGAFRKQILGLYDSRCSACGMRLIVNGAAIVEAAHLIPWSEGHNDHPSNGIALCKNHHWAMDRHWISPGIDRRWLVSPLLDERVSDNRDLISINGQKLFEPDEKKFMPNEECLRWRQDRLLV